MPAVEVDREQKRSNHHTHKMKDPILVLDERKSELITVARDKIIYLPKKINGQRKKENYFLLCDYNASDCFQMRQNGKTCEKVHAELEGCPRKLIHINYSWRYLEECFYARFHAGQKVKIREPASANSDVVDIIDTGYVLFTRCVFDDPARPATHCAHFYYGRECQMGHKCDFAHVLHIDPDAQSLRKAPAPNKFGRKRCNESNQPAHDEASLQKSSAVTTPPTFPFTLPIVYMSALDLTKLNTSFGKTSLQMIPMQSSMYPSI